MTEKTGFEVNNAPSLESTSFYRPAGLTSYKENASCSKSEARIQVRGIQDEETISRGRRPARGYRGFTRYLCEGAGRSILHFFVLLAAAGPAQRPSGPKRRAASLANNFAESEALTGTFFTPSTVRVCACVPPFLVKTLRGCGGGGGGGCQGSPILNRCQLTARARHEISRSI